MIHIGRNFNYPAFYFDLRKFPSAQFYSPLPWATISNSNHWERKVLFLSRDLKKNEVRCIFSIIVFDLLSVVEAGISLLSGFVEEDNFLTSQTSTTTGMEDPGEIAFPEVWSVPTVHLAMLVPPELEAFNALEQFSLMWSNGPSNSGLAGTSVNLKSPPPSSTIALDEDTAGRLGGDLRLFSPW